MREKTAEALGEIGPEAASAVPALIEALRDPKAGVREKTAEALGEIGPEAASAVPALIEALKDREARVRKNAAWTLAFGKIGPEAASAVPALIEALKDREARVRENAAAALAVIGPKAASAVPALIEALKDREARVRKNAAWALAFGKIGPEAASAVPALIEALKDREAEVRKNAARALAFGKIGPEAAPAVPALIEALKDREAEVRENAAEALKAIGLQAVPAVPALIEALRDQEYIVRYNAAEALKAIGLQAVPAVPALIEALRDQEYIVRYNAAEALKAIGLQAVPAVLPALIEALKDREAQVRENAAEALGEIGLQAVPAVPALIEALRDQEYMVRYNAAEALGKIGPEAPPVLSALIEALKDQAPAIRTYAADTLASIAIKLQNRGDTSLVSELRNARDALKESPDSAVKMHADTVRRAVDSLEASRWRRVGDIVNEHPYWATIVAAVPAWILICVGIFWISPLAIIKINDALRSLDIKLPRQFGGVTIPLRHLLLIGALNYRPRVLDAWVARHVGKARDNFERKRTVAARSVHVPVPVHFNNATIPELKAHHLRGIFAAGTGRLLIWGEGGSGKTSIACQIARWAMADAPAQRPARHRMLPVLIERELDFEVGEKRDPFTETVRGDLKKLIEARIGGDLLIALLERRRILVIVDHLSEMTDATRHRVRPDVPDFPAGALIVTSRIEERLGDVPKNSLEPLRVTGDYLFEFMGAYLRARGVRDLFPDREFGQAGARIAELVGERKVTVLLVKLYLDRLVEVKETGGDVEREMPESIPSLMLQYLNDINRAVREQVRRDEREVHRDAKALAWACLKGYFPAVAQIDETAEPALAKVDPMGIGDRLDYLEHRLGLIETVEPERDKVRFALDPVAEYLAGLHIVERYQADADAWRAFLDLADATPGGPEAARSFLLATRDCCLAREGELPVPEFVPNELAKRAGLELEQIYASA